MVMDEHEVRALLRRRCDEADGQGAWAAAAEPKLSPAYVSDVLSGKRGFGPAILARLGLEVAYRPTDVRHSLSQPQPAPVKAKRKKAP